MQKNSKAIFDDSKMRPLSKNERKSEQIQSLLQIGRCTSAIINQNFKNAKYQKQNDTEDNFTFPKGQKAIYSSKKSNFSSQISQDIPQNSIKQKSILSQDCKKSVIQKRTPNKEHKYAQINFSDQKIKTYGSFQNLITENHFQSLKDGLDYNNNIWIDEIMQMNFSNQSIKKQKESRQSQKFQNMLEKNLLMKKDKLNQVIIKNNILNRIKIQCEGQISSLCKEQEITDNQLIQHVSKIIKFKKSNQIQKQTSLSSQSDFNKIFRKNSFILQDALQIKSNPYPQQKIYSSTPKHEIKNVIDFKPKQIRSKNTFFDFLKSKQQLLKPRDQQLLRFQNKFHNDKKILMEDIDQSFEIYQSIDFRDKENYQSMSNQQSLQQQIQTQLTRSTPEVIKKNQRYVLKKQQQQSLHQNNNLSQETKNQQEQLENFVEKQYSPQKFTITKYDSTYQRTNQSSQDYFRPHIAETHFKPKSSKPSKYTEEEIICGWSHSKNQSFDQD